MTRDPREGILPGDDAMPPRPDALLNQNGATPAAPSAAPRKRPRRTGPENDMGAAALAEQVALEETLRIVASPGRRVKPAPATGDGKADGGPQARNAEPIESYIPISAPLPISTDTPDSPRASDVATAPRPAAARPRGLMVGLGVGALAVGIVGGLLWELGRAGRLPVSAGRTTVASSEQRTAMPPGKPDPALTPGSANPGAFDIEKAGLLGAAAPPIPDSIRRQAFRAYGIPESDASRYVPIRLIPASLNGDDSAANVFPVTPWFSNLKARLDKALTVKVTVGEMTLEDAHKELTRDWIAASHKNYVRNYGEQDEAAAKQVEQSRTWAKPSPEPSTSAAAAEIPQ